MRVLRTPAALDALEEFSEKAPAELRARVPKLDVLMTCVDGEHDRLHRSGPQHRGAVAGKVHPRSGDGAPRIRGIQNEVKPSLIDTHGGVRTSFQSQIWHGKAFRKPSGRLSCLGINGDWYQ